MILSLLTGSWVANQQQQQQQKKALNSRSGFKSQAVPDLKQRVGLHQARVAHHLILGPDTGSNYGGRQITKKLFLPTLI